MLHFLVFTHLFSRGNNNLGKKTCLDTGHKKRTRTYIYDRGFRLCSQVMLLFASKLDEHSPLIIWSKSIKRRMKGPGRVKGLWKP